MRHAYREVALTGAPGARHPRYLLPRNYQCFAELDDCGHASETLHPGATEHGSSCETGWVDLDDVYVLDANGQFLGFRKPDGTMGTAEENQADAARYSRNYGLDARMCHIFNHTHDCKATCFKYDQTKPVRKAQQDTAAATPQRQSCRFRFWRVIEIGGKVFRRLGKALVLTPFVAHKEDDNNEYGRCIVRRHNCFRGSSNDLCQVSLRCNVDLQYQVRTFPEQNLDGAAEHATTHEDVAAAKCTKNGTLPRLLRRLSRKVPEAKELLVSAAIAMRSSHVADFYATKYLAKPQQWLHSVLGPLILGFRRAEEKAAAITEEKPSIYKEALRKVRTAIFAANRSIWISCCEAALFLNTGGTAIFSHADVPVHARLGLSMMHECKRILNKEVAGSGLWETRLPEESNEQAGVVFDVASVEPIADLSDSDNETTMEQQEEQANPLEPQEQDATVPQASTGTMDAAEEQCEVADVGAVGRSPVVEDGGDGSGGRQTRQSKPASVQLFQVTISVRDDWLHRGLALHDMDLNTYASQVEREEKAFLHTAQQAKVGLLIPFDAHYKLAGNYAQKVAMRSSVISRYVGPNCERETVNDGEENAAYKAFHCSLLRCPGPGQCADPLMCQEVLFPNAAGRYCFRQHWRAREAEILVLAARGQEKKLRARRLETLADTTLCKGQPVGMRGGAPEHIMEAALCRIEVLRIFRQKIRILCSSNQTCLRVCVERPVDLILQLTGIPSLWHPDQLHLAEWQAMQQLEFIFNVTLSVDAKNMALAKLAKHKGLSLIDAEMSLEPARDPTSNSFEMEDVGGLGDEDDVAEERVETTGLLPPSFSETEIIAFLWRVEEVQLAKQPGQGRREGLQNMRQVDAAFGESLRQLQFVPEPLACSRYGAAEHTLQAAIENQKTQLASLRDQELTIPATISAQQQARDHVDPSDLGVELVDDAHLGASEHMRPTVFAKQLCDAATLNRDQRRPVALIALELERAWQSERQRRAALTPNEQDDVQMQQWTIPLSGRLCRMLIYGSGGCGKTRLINMVLSPLFKRYFGPRGLVTTAFSNKAARLVNGKTSHALAKLRGTKSLAMPHLRLRGDKDSRALAAVWVPAGALVKDEFSQQSASLEHALAVRAMYGRYCAHGLARDVQYRLSVKRTGVLPLLLYQTIAPQTIVVFSELAEAYPFSSRPSHEQPLRSQV